jgi:2-polyprenyl-3-methyl-5-hydroxy-6-metoxy-1,4-benzoquinol methylase
MTSKNNVYKNYEKIADWFDKHRSRKFFEKSYLDKVISYLQPGATILDLGCGMGEPIAQYFIEQGFDLTGIDGSSKLIGFAQQRFPSTTWMIEDMRHIKLLQKFDCLIVWHSLFHLPADDQRKMFAIFADHLMQNGMLLFTSGHEAGEVWSDNGGENLYHASLSADEYEKLLKQYGFELLLHNMQDENCGGATVWMARLDS